MYIEQYLNMYNKLYKKVDITYKYLKTSKPSDIVWHIESSIDRWVRMVEVMKKLIF